VDRGLSGVESTTTALVRAAGGLVWRVDENGRPEVLLVHRPGFDDWTFPKGKVDPDDVDDEHTALREVAEETGLRCALGRELPGIDYVDRKNRPKHVRYWEMRVLSGEFAPNREVDETRWCTLPDAGALLTYERDTDVLAAFADFAGAPPR
jgi:8-oxo-dGTP pyrophosphatase MutT (NUDIX family)